MKRIVEKFKESHQKALADRAAVRAHPVIKNIISMLVTIIDVFVMFVLVWNTFTYCIPTGSWINIVDGNSMDPTVLHGQIMFTDMSKINRGDIVTLTVPERLQESDSKYKTAILVKRIVGMPGDRVIIDSNGVYVNNALMDEFYLTEDAKNNTYVQDMCNSVLLAEDEFFVMGDNRGASFDSRSFGVIKKSNILYKQSIEPTTNFFLKLTLVIIIFLIDIIIYFLIEFILTECAYAIFFKKNVEKENNTDEIHTTTETVTLKGDKNGNNNGL